MAENRRKAIEIVLLMILLIAVSRGITLTHNMELHPDENVFVRAAVSLKDKIMGLEDVYVEAKEYPEGAYIFQLPFHVVAQMIKQMGGRPVSGFVTGRIASVFYYSAAAVLGFFFLYRYIDRRHVTLLIYAATMVFSLFHIEQSRYGTGDAITIFLLGMEILCCAAASGGKKKVSLLLTAALFSGFLAAVKYPLAFFLCIPVIMLWRLCREKTVMKRIGLAAMLGVVALAGFLICSPKVIRDPLYVARVILTESRAYLRGGNLYTLGGWYNHVASVTVYALFYSGFPLAMGLMCYAIGSRWKKRAIREDVDFLFNLVIPLVVFVFFIYNISIISLFMRAFYPFLFLADIYAATAVGELYDNGGKKLRSLLCVLALIMICRGVFFLYTLSEHDSGKRVDRLILEAEDENWRETSLVATRPLSGPYLSFDSNLLRNSKEVYIQDERFMQPDTAELRPGEMVITGTEAFSRSNRYMIPFDSDMVHDLICNWETFQDVNEPYLIGRPYPTYYYYLFGYWIKGTTGTDYEFPTNYVYYRSE